VLVAVGLLAGAVFAGVGWASHERSASASVEPAAGPSGVAPSFANSPAATTSSAAVAGNQQWARVLAALDDARDRALTDVDPDELGSVYVASSPALAADRETMRELVVAGEHARGLDLRLTSVTVRSQSPTAVVLDVRDVLPAYDLVRADGSADHQAGRGERSWLVTLRAQQAGAPWRIDTIGAG